MHSGYDKNAKQKRWVFNFDLKITVITVHLIHETCFFIEWQDLLPVIVGFLSVLMREKFKQEKFHMMGYRMESNRLCAKHASSALVKHTLWSFLKS